MSLYTVRAVLTLEVEVSFQIEAPSWDAAWARADHLADHVSIEGYEPARRQVDGVILAFEEVDQQCLVEDVDELE